MAAVTLAVPIEGKPPIEHLYDYTRDSEGCQANPICMEAVTKLIEDVGSEVKGDTALIVYRGQRESRTIDPSRHSWFSTSLSLEETEIFRGDICCIFKIHLMPGVTYLDVNKALTESKYAAGSVSAGTRMKDPTMTHGLANEKEIIVMGGGTFYSDTIGTTGFKEIREGVYETWYSLTPISKAAVGGAGTAPTVIPTKPEKKKVTRPELRARIKKIEGDDPITNMDNNAEIRLYLNPDEVLIGGARRKRKQSKRRRRQSKRVSRRYKK